jgi:hypothetical protein
MTQTKLQHFILAALFFLSGADLFAQTRSFVGRLVSREYRIITNCSTSAPASQSLGPGLALPLPKLPECDFNFPNNTSRMVKPVFSSFTVDLPQETPTGQLSATGSSATLTFAQPLTLRLASEVNWALNPPDSQSTGTHRASYSIDVEGGGSDIGSCVGERTSGNSSGTLNLNANCTVTRATGSWNAASQTANLTIATTTGFRFGNANGEYTVQVRGTYEFTSLDIDHVEALQTVQTSDNRVPLVAGKPAMIRVFPSTGMIGGLQVRVLIYRNDELVQTLESGTIPATGSPTVPRDDLSRTANFVLPPALTGAGTLRVDAQIRVSGQSTYQAARSFNLNFQNAPGWKNPYPVLKLQYIDRDVPNLAAGMRLFSSIAPFNSYSEYAVEAPAGSTPPFFRLFRLRSLFEAQQAPATWPEVYVALNGADPLEALSDPSYPVGMKKLASLSGDAATTFSCVVGENLGLARAASSIGDPGLAPTFDLLLNPTTADFMSCDSSNPAWISSGNAIRLIEAYKDRPSAPAANADAADLILITGVIAGGGSSATFYPPVRIRTANPAPPSEGSACLSFFTGGGESAGADACFNRAASDVDTPFALAVNMPASTERIALVIDGTELGSIRKSANAPEVKFSAPPSDAPSRYLNLSWSGSDADGDALEYQVWASTDGGNWYVPVAVDLTGGGYALDTAKFASVSSIYLQVRAADGFNEGVDTIGPITLTAPPAADPVASVRLTDTRVNEGRFVTIPVRNGGEGTLQVTAVESSLPSLSYVGTALPLIIPAGQTGDLRIHFSAAEAGTISANLTIRTNDPARATITVPVEGSVYTQLGPNAVLSTPALDFGTVAIGGGTADRTVRVTNRGTAALDLTSITLGPAPGLRLITGNSATVAPGASTDITLRCAPTSTNYVAGTLTIASNDSIRPSISVPVACEGAAATLDVPAIPVDFGTVANGQTRNQQVTIRNLSSQSVNITGATFTNSQFRLITPRLPFSIAPSASATLDLQFAPIVAGLATATMALNTDDPSVTAQISLRGNGTGSTQTNGRLVVEPNQLVFGDVIVNQNRTLPLILRNAGSGLLTVTSVVSNNPVFTISGATFPASIQVGATVELQVRFSPTAATASNSVLTITSDSSTGSDLLLSVTGAGLPIPSTTVSNLSAPLRQDWVPRVFLTSFEDAILRLVRFDNAGTQQSDTGVTIPAGSQLRPDLDSGAGWAQVRVTKGSIQGFVQFTGQQAQTYDVIPLNPALATRLIMTGLERGSDILINNLISDNVTVGLELRASSGAIIGTQNLQLGARASIAQRVEQLFSNVPQGFQGYLILLSTQGIQATRTNSGATAMELSPAQPAPEIGTRNVALYAPRIQAGNGWLARLQIVNPTDREARIKIRSASAAGVPITGSPVEVVLPPFNAYWREFTQIYNLDGNITWNASITVESNIAGVVGEVSYGNSFARASYAMVEAVSKKSVVPINTANTSFYVFNPNPTAATIDMRNLQEDGTYSTGRRVTVPPGGYYGGPSGLVQSPALQIESDLGVVSHATLAADQVVDFGILPAVSLDGGSIVTPPAGTSPKLQVDPATLDFGSVVIGQSRTLTLSIRNGGTAALVVSSITSNSARYTVEGTSLPLNITPGSTQQVLVRYTPSAPAAEQNAFITVTSNDTVTGPVIIQLKGTSVATDIPKVRVEVSPTTMDFGDVNSGQTKDIQLVIRNGGSDPLVVSGVTVNNTRFQLVSASFPLTVIPAGLATVVVRFAPAVAGVQNGTLTLTSNDPANPTVSVALRGNGVGAASSPRIVVSVGMIEFGIVQVGQQGEQTFEIRNTGTAALVIQSMTIDNNTYSVGPPAPFTLLPNAIADIGVLFKPKEPGAQPANLRIISNDPVNPTIVIPMTGLGQ